MSPSGRTRTALTRQTSDTLAVSFTPETVQVEPAAAEIEEKDFDRTPGQATGRPG